MIHDLCIIMLTAGLTSLLFKLLKQPVVLGYIVAGILVGPYVLGESWVSNEESVDTWGQIGVLFLLFALGLEFSFKKLLQIGSTAIIAASTIVVGMMALGFLTGRLCGWNSMNALFLGGMLCMSSTTIVFKALDDMGLRNRMFAKICFGILVVEDLFAVILMVLLSSVATSKSFEGGALLLQIGKLAAYLVFWFVTGIALLPLFLRKFRRHLNDETLTIFSVGLCLGMVLLATSAGFSSALGAFVMGSVLAETLDAERIEHLIAPVKNIFGAIFFVSVGMMINPGQLAQHWLPILLITLVVILGQITFAGIGTLLSGQSLKIAIQTGFSLVQIGEFAFIIAGLGQTLGVTDSSLYPIVVAVSVITTFLTPYIIRGAEPTYHFIFNRLSDRTKQTLENYAQSRNNATPSSTFRILLRRTLLSLIIYGVIIAFIDTLYLTYIAPFIQHTFDDILPTWLIHTIQLTLLLLLTSPLLYAMSSVHRNSTEAKQLWNSTAFKKVQLIGITLLRAVTTILFITYAVVSIFSLTFGMLVAIVIIILLTLVLSRRIHRQSVALQQQFSANLSAREKSAEEKRTLSTTLTHSFLTYDLHTTDFLLPPSSRFCGQTLMQLDIRQHAGVSIVRIVRAGININIPGGRTRLFPGDQIVVAGSDEQIDRFRQMLDNSLTPEDTPPARIPVTVTRFAITDTHPLIGTTIADSHIRERAQCIVIGIERDNQLISNPDPKIQFQPNDIVILAGETQRIKDMLQTEV